MRVAARRPWPVRHLHVAIAATCSSSSICASLLRRVSLPLCAHDPADVVVLLVRRAAAIGVHQSLLHYGAPYELPASRGAAALCAPIVPPVLRARRLPRLPHASTLVSRPRLPACFSIIALMHCSASRSVTGRFKSLVQCASSSPSQFLILLPVTLLLEDNYERPGNQRNTRVEAPGRRVGASLAAGVLGAALGLGALRGPCWVPAARPRSRSWSSWRTRRPSKTLRRYRLQELQARLDAASSPPGPGRRAGREH